MQADPCILKSPNVSIGFARKVINAAIMSYEDLRHLPVLNGVTIIGDKRLEDFGLVPFNTEEITEIMLEVFGYVL